MTLIRKPFTTTILDEDRVPNAGKVITVRLNDDEAKLLERQRQALDMDSESGIIKLLWLTGWNVVTTSLTEERLARLCRRDRARYKGPKYRSGGGPNE